MTAGILAAHCCIVRLNATTSKYIFQHFPIGFIFRREISFDIYVSHFHSFINMIESRMGCVFVYTYFVYS